MSGSLEFVDSASHVSQLSLGMPGSASRVLEGRELLYLLSFPKLWSSALASKNSICRAFFPASCSAVFWDDARYFLASLSTLLTQVPLSYVSVRGRERRENT